MPSAPVDEAGLEAWARRFASTLKPPAAIALSGELGAGKTTLVRALARVWGVGSGVTSPTFALVHRYRGPSLNLYHVDAYRLRPHDDPRDLGIDDMLSDPRGIVLIEWPERLGDSAPAFTHRIALSHTDRADQRVIEVR